MSLLKKSRMKLKIKQTTFKKLLTNNEISSIINSVKKKQAVSHLASEVATVITKIDM